MSGSYNIQDRTISTTPQRPRVAYCECGARLAGGSVRELLDVAEWHFVRCHPQWLPQDFERPLIRRAALGPAAHLDGTRGLSAERGVKPWLQPTAQPQGGS